MNLDRRSNIKSHVKYHRLKWQKVYVMQIVNWRPELVENNDGHWARENFIILRDIPKPNKH